KLERSYWFDGFGATAEENGPGEIKLCCNGSSMDNPGPEGCGSVFRDHNGGVIGVLSMNLVLFTLKLLVPIALQEDRGHVIGFHNADIIVNRPISDTADRDDDITIAYVFILFMMGHLWFQTANDTVQLGFLATVADLEEAAQYDWGSAILASLYHGLDTAVTSGGVITSFAQLLTERGNKKKANNQADNLFILGIYYIDHRTIETITWKPWLDSVVFEIKDVLTAKLISRKRMPLQVPNGNCEYYLGERCWRQLTGEAYIPLDPPLNMSQHISPAALQEMRQVVFLDCEKFVIEEERETYASYWAEQTFKVGHLLTDFQRMGNIDMFGPTALRAGIIPVAITSALVHSLS
ncbi:hypothetical protein GIB67_011908, partial [Kingdonia uniflora]